MDTNINIGENRNQTHEDVIGMADFKTPDKSEV